MDFIEKLIINKAQHLAFYFMINGLVDYSKLNIGTLTIAYKKEITDLYGTVKNDLATRHFSRKNFEIIGCLIAEYNNIYSKINRFNYGTEGHIIGFLPDFDEPINEAINEPINTVINDNINMKNKRYFDYLIFYLNCFNENQQQDDENPYTLSEYFKKIGIDIAIYEFLKPLNHTKTPKPLDHTTIPNPINFDKLMDLFFKSMKEAYAEYYNKKFFNKMKEIYRKIINEKEEDSKNMKKKQDKDRIKLLQQYFNLYKYPNLKINDNNIVFYNTVKIKFEDFDSIIRNIYNDKISKKFQRKLLDIFTIDETSKDLSSKSSEKIHKNIQTSPINEIAETIETQTSANGKSMQVSEPRQILEEKTLVKSSSLSLSKSKSVDLKTPDKKTKIDELKKYKRRIRGKDNIQKLFKILISLKDNSQNYKSTIEETLKLYHEFITEFKNLLNEKINEDEIQYIERFFDIFSYLFKLFERVKEVQIKKIEYDELKVEYYDLKVLLKEILKIIKLKLYKLDSTITNKKQIKKILKQNLKYYTLLYKIYSNKTVFDKILTYLNEINRTMQIPNLDTTYLQLLKKHYENIVIQVLEQYTQNPKIQEFLTEFQEIIKDESNFQSLRDNFRKEFSQVFR